MKNPQPMSNKNTMQLFIECANLAKVLARVRASIPVKTRGDVDKKTVLAFAQGRLHIDSHQPRHPVVILAQKKCITFLRK